jgi:O-antigen ligase
MEALKVRVPWFQTVLPVSEIAPRASMAAFFLVFVLAVSLISKWASLHLAGLLLVFSVGFARRSDWRTPAMQTYLLCTALWLIPVLLVAGLQHALGVVTAPEWSELPILVLRMLGIGLGLIVLVQRGWLTLYSASFALLAALAIHAGAGVIDWILTPDAGLHGWRELRIKGLLYNPNPFGTFMAFAAILAAGVLRNSPRRMAIWAILIAALLGVWVSGSRSALLVAGVGFAILFPPTRREHWYVYLGAVVLAALFFWYASLRTYSLYSASDNERLMALSYTLEKIRMSPWIGWGIGAYEGLPDRVGPQSPHNMLLDLAFNSGLPVLVAWVLSTALLVSRLRRSEHAAARLALAMLAATIMAGMTEYSILLSTHFRGIWVFVTALACCTLGTGVAASTPPATLRTSPAP